MTLRNCIKLKKYFPQSNHFLWRIEKVWQKSLILIFYQGACGDDVATQGADSPAQRCVLTRSRPVIINITLSFLALKPNHFNYLTCFATIIIRQQYIGRFVVETMGQSLAIIFSCLNDLTSKHKVSSTINNFQIVTFPYQWTRFISQRTFVQWVQEVLL